MNVAIQGSGFFVVNTGDSVAYTRAGNFSFDNNGVLVMPDGSKVQGWTAVDAATGNIVTTGAVGDIAVPPGVLRAPTATTSFSAVTNLNSDAAVGDAFASSVQIFDALGTPHVITLTYTKTAAGAWNYKAEAPGAEVTGGTAGTPFQLMAGTLTFDATGKLATMTPTAPAAGGGTAPTLADVTFTTPTWKSGAAASALTFDVVDADGQAALSGFKASSATSSVNQNGSGAGMISTMSVRADGTVMATFGAGQTVAVGQLALAGFNNPRGLNKLGSNLYGETQAAGVPNVGVPGTSGRGSLIGSAIEQSNVDIAQEFTSMILAQRGYQANSKSITTSDEMLVETLNLKR
jgi:flagellar hook protein FlgE